MRRDDVPLENNLGQVRMDENKSVTHESLRVIKAEVGVALLEYIQRTGVSGAFQPLRYLGETEYQTK